MGGVGRRFVTTHWTEIAAARTLDDDRRREAIGTVLGRYWKPMYCFLRRKGHSNEAAKDIVQGFCQEVALGRGLVEKADPQRGRFRSFLLTALTHYASNVWRDGKALKRAPVAAVLSLEVADAMDMPAISREATPEETFNYAWACQLLDSVLSAVEAGCVEDGMEVHWRVFCERVAVPLMDHAPPPSLPSLCEKYTISDESKVSNMAVTVKRRFQAELAKHVRKAVGSDADVVQEIRDLMEILSSSRARS